MKVEAFLLCRKVTQNKDGSVTTDGRLEIAGTPRLPSILEINIYTRLSFEKTEGRKHFFEISITDPKNIPAIVPLKGNFRTQDGSEVEFAQFVVTPRLNIKNEGVYNFNLEIDGSIASNTSLTIIAGVGSPN